MKRMLIFLLSIIIVATCFGPAFSASVGMPPELKAQEQPHEHPAQIGRYALYQGEYANVDGASGKIRKEHDLLLLDTATGKVWRAVSVTAHEQGKPVVKRHWELFDTNGSK